MDENGKPIRSDLKATLALTLGIRGLYIGFNNLEHNDWIPKGTQDYADLFDVNTIGVKTALSIDLGTESGVYELKELLKTIINSGLLPIEFSKELQVLINILDRNNVSIGVSVEVRAYIGTLINDVLTGQGLNLDIIQLLKDAQATIRIDITRHEENSDAIIDVSNIVIGYMNGDLYVDLSGLNDTLGRIKMEGLLDTVIKLLGNTSTVQQSSEKAMKEVREFVKARALVAQNGSSALSQEETLAAYIRLVMSGADGLSATVVYGAIYTVIKDLIGLDSIASVFELISDVSNPSLTANLGYDVKFGLIVKIPSNVFADDDYKNLNELIADAKEYFGYAGINEKVLVYGAQYNEKVASVDGEDFTAYKAYGEIIAKTRTLPLVRRRQGRNHRRYD